MLFKDGRMVEKSHREGAVTRDQVIAYLEQFGIVPQKESSFNSASPEEA